MKFDDLSQNLNARIVTIQVIAFILLAVLGVRLYYLQIVKGDSYAERAEEQRIRRLPIPAQRGAILDRNGKVLVDSRPTYNIILSRDALKKVDVAALVAPLTEGLEVDGEVLQERLEAAKVQTSGFESVMIKESAGVNDITWVEAHNLEIPELRVELQPQRNYPLGKTLAHVLGYVGEVSKKQLDDPKYSARGIRSGDVIGKDGLESTYDEVLRGRDGYREVVVDSRSRIKEEIRVVPPQPGQDLVTTIDLDLQLTAEKELEESATKRGVVIAMDPNNDEILVLASAPSYDPNIFSRAGNSKEGRRMINALYNDPQKPLLNRAIRGRYYPGSTWKIPESVAALQQGAITVKDSRIVCGGGLQTGNRFTRDTSGNHGTPDLPDAITHSCDGYYYRLSLKMKPEGFIKLVEEFQYDKQTGIDLPAELISRTPKYYKPIKEKSGRWGDIDTVFSSIGQVYVEVTPISMIRAVSSIGVGGRMYVPHFFKEARAVEAVGDADTPEFQPSRPAIGYNAPEPVIISMTPEQNALVLKGMWGVVNNGGTAGRIKMANWEFAGKTGTAQNSAIGSGGAKDHAWFVSFGPFTKPEISVIALIENSGFGSSNAAPAVRGVYETYLQKKGIDYDGKQTAAAAVIKN